MCNNEISIGISRYEKMIKEDAEEEGFNCMENSAVFAVSMFQYISMALVFAKGEPFRKHPFTNGIRVFGYYIHVSLAGLAFHIFFWFLQKPPWCTLF